MMRYLGELTRESGRASRVDGSRGGRKDSPKGVEQKDKRLSNEEVMPSLDNTWPLTLRSDRGRGKITRPAEVGGRGGEETDLGASRRGPPYLNS